jgi:hypothetical protein
MNEEVKEKKKKRKKKGKGSLNDYYSLTKINVTVEIDDKTKKMRAFATYRL